MLIAERDRGDDGDRPGTDGPDRGEHGGQREHDPGHRANPPANGPHRQLHQPVHGAVVLRHCEQVRDPDQGEEQVAREPGDDVVGGLACDQGADQEGRRERQPPDIDRQDRAANTDTTGAGEGAEAGTGRAQAEPASRAARSNRLR
jgi:hypothetical protein